MNEKLLKKYAKVAVKIGVNVQPEQMLVINAPVDAKEFVHYCVEEAYLAGAQEVEVRWNDSVLTRLNYENVKTEVLKNVPEWTINRHKAAIDRKCAILNIISEVPGNLKHIAPEKLQECMMANSKAMEPYRYYTMSNYGQWSIVAIPNPIWAKMIFPELEEEVAIEKLWESILKSVRIDEDNDPVSDWNKHNKELSDHNKILNEYNFKSLHFKNGIGTDLVVELVENHIWEGGSDDSQSGITFNPNMPTEETFTMPKRTGVNGKVYGTKPLNYQGKLIENFWIRFKDGKAVEYDAEKEKEALGNLINMDEGSCYLGEVALISHDSPISNMNILFLNTLFDENASCHLALGAAYPSNLKNSESLSKEELVEKGGNVSMAHSDFMFGSHDMSIIGITQDNKQIEVFKEGNFCI